MGHKQAEHVLGKEDSLFAVLCLLYPADPSHPLYSAVSLWRENGWNTRVAGFWCTDHRVDNRVVSRMVATSIKMSLTQWQARHVQPDTG